MMSSMSERSLDHKLNVVDCMASALRRHKTCQWAIITFWFDATLS